MWQKLRMILVVEVLAFVLGGSQYAHAQCALPYTLTNGQTPDASKVMANFNALVTCLTPGGSTNAVQYNAGAGSLGGVGPLTDGQLVIGSTGNVPQAQTLTAGSGVTITNTPGSITIAATPGTGNGLYHQVMSATPTTANTGLTNWINQGTATVTDSSVGIVINAPSSGTSGNVHARSMAAPTPPYTIRALIAATRNSNNDSSVGIGWANASNKLHILTYDTNGGGPSYIQIIKWNTPTSAAGADFLSSANAFSQPIWLQIQDDGTNVSFAFSQDGANFLPVFTVAKSSGFLGATGYSNVIFFTNPQGGQTLGTLLSWTQS